MGFSSRVDVRDETVHVDNCCAVHGCRYGDHDCPVTSYQAKQAFPCEECDALAEAAEDRW